MTRTATELLENAVRTLAPDPDANPLVPLIARGEASRDTLAALALEQHWVIPADRTAFLHLAQRANEPDIAAYFETLAEGETLAGRHLESFAAACGVDEARTRSYDPLPGCQAYPSCIAWLALNASPADAVVAITANFSAWGGYCATIAKSLRTHYAFTPEACAFFDFFAEPSPDLDQKATAAVQKGLNTNTVNEQQAHRYGRLLQTYESLFWKTLLQPT
ncbi:transcriptional regulator [Streptomyces sp. NBC_00588]|uniref:transcriptional regulator n=1 Tax=Streptomyces sp. NBC_00588 TaxID=2975784 RepID=UPI002E80D9AD|nr:transcriptional regulator [Streptomyces sp. NBC_00588]WUB39977.1 transcriptional regulator [Streptomyces sp. NBC_00588]